MMSIKQRNKENYRRQYISGEYCRSTSLSNKKDADMGYPLENTKNHVFQAGNLELRPMTLTFGLIQNIIKVNLHAKFRAHASNSAAVRALADTWTHRQEWCYTLDIWCMGGYSCKSHNEIIWPFMYLLWTNGFIFLSLPCFWEGQARGPWLLC